MSICYKRISSNRKRPRIAIVSLAVFAVSLCPTNALFPRDTSVSQKASNPLPFHNPIQYLPRSLVPVARLTHILAKVGNTEEEDPWEAGDVYKDLELLEQGIRLASADVNLQQSERLDLLDHLAGSKRVLYPDISRYILLPLAGAFCLRMLPNQKLTSFLRGLSNFQFWSTMVVAPIMLLIVKRITKPQPEPMPEYLRGIPLDEVSIAIEWEAPEKSCKDAALLLLEYWTSTVATMAFLGALQLGALTVGAISIPRFVQGWVRVVQCVTRWAVVAALYQNQEQVYQVQRPKQPRPLTFLTTILQPLLSSIMFLLPVGFAMDFYSILTVMPVEAVTAVYTTIFVAGVGTSLRLQEQQQQAILEDRVAHLRSLKTSTRWLYTAASLIIARIPLRRLLHRHGISWPVIKEFMLLPAAKAWPQFCRACGQVSLWASAGVFTLIVPIVTLRSAAKLIRIVRTHNSSLAMDSADFFSATQDTSRIKWRYFLEWQENPQRLGQVFQKWRSNLAYWIFLEGRGEDILIQSRKKEIERAASSQKWHLRRRFLEDKEQGKSFLPQSQWLQNASETIAAKHQADYDHKTFEDPLGIALQQTLGIGLGFQFDHDKPLKQGEKPSLLRLQARAAKSAIRRVQQLYDADLAREELNAISDANKRSKRASEMRKETEEEIEHLAQRMLDLVPPLDPSATEFSGRSMMKRFQQRKVSRWVKVNSHEMRPLYEDPEDAVKSIEEDIANFEA